MPILWLLAGVNGAGKTTFASSPEFQALVGTAVLLNPDALTEIIRARNPEFCRSIKPTSRRPITSK